MGDPRTRRRLRPAGRRAEDDSANADEVRAALVDGRSADAVARTVATYGPELFGFLTVSLSDHHDAREVYLSFGDQLPTDLRAFEWRCELRTFVYYLGRRELARHRARAALLPTERQLAAPTSVASLTRRMSRADSAARLRRSLSHEDRDLLVLRLDRGLAWRALAITTLGENAAEQALMVEAERLRRRFSEIRTRVVARAARHRAS
jgi:RNA polymerase sigma-70 factor (ECF subfamily)